MGIIREHWELLRTLRPREFGTVAVVIAIGVLVTSAGVLFGFSLKEVVRWIFSYLAAHLAGDF